MLEWDSRPYDYIYYYPTISKGSPIIVNLALNYPNKNQNLSISYRIGVFKKFYICSPHTY